ncbi:MAG: tRNA uridine-5-carboxymethylaminomethyl(34) synthesis GTPase MnmE [Opitutales bacterium]
MVTPFMHASDTICALSTPAGEGALAVIRISGPQATALWEGFSGRPALPAPRRATRFAYTSRDGLPFDDGLALYFPAPYSFTGEDVFELSLHGNPLIASSVLDDLRARGARLADPGEFTRRAFLNGKLDLSQAEAVADVIAARSLGALTAARQHLRGDLGRRMSELADVLTQAVAEIEAYLDFPDEDLPPEDHSGPLARLKQLSTELASLSATRETRRLLLEGLPTVIAGAPNAGKSSLLNALLGVERALVSPIAGTTRDYLTERLQVGNHLLRLVDTAGLHSAEDEVERAGIARARAQLAEAGLILLVLDQSQPPPVWPEAFDTLIDAKPVLVVRNKADLSEDPATASLYPGRPSVRVSATDAAEARATVVPALAALLQAGGLAPDPDDLMLNARHADAIDRGRAAIDRARSIAADGALEIAAEELRSALEALGEVVGRIDAEDVLDKLFASFCIGK